MTSEEEANAETVLVTGGSGFVGGWAIVELLRAGYRVRATIRDLAREKDVRATISRHIDLDDRLAFFAADLQKDDGWGHAADGSNYVLHVASPMPVGEFRGQDVVRPAREGTRRVLEASVKAGVKRVVITSSTTAAMPKDVSATVDESIWTDLPDKPIYNYPRSKTFAEQDAWAFIRESGGSTELTTVLPSSIQGPVLGSDYSASVGIVALMLQGKLPVIPHYGFSIVDVRDLVRLHILAMVSPNAAGERFIGSGNFLWMGDIAHILRSELKSKARKVSTRGLPDFVVRIGALFNAEMAQIAPDLSVRRKVSSAKAERLLGWRTRPAKESILDTANSLINLSLV